MAPIRKAKQLDLGGAPARAAEAVASTAPALPPSARIDYQHGADRWICQRFDALAAELPGLTTAEMSRFQSALEVNERQWTLVRRYYGVMPQVLPVKYPMDDARVWAREELARFLNVAKGEQWQQELQAVRGIWEAVKPRVEEAGPTVPPPNRGLFSDDEIVQKHDFGRVRFKDQSEMSRFVVRLVRLEKLFLEPATDGLARTLLMTELQLSRLDEALAGIEHTGQDYRSNLKSRSDLVNEQAKQLTLIDALAPWFGAIQGKYSFKGALAEITEAMQRYHQSGGADTELIDGIFTSTEVQVLCRRSVQAPAPQYRLGWVANALEAKANLWNPKWAPSIPLPVLKRMDACMKKAIQETGQEMGEKVPDLAKGEEYPPLMIAVKEEG